MLEEFSNTKELNYLKSKKYSALIGNPTEHSISDIMFSRMVELFGLPFDYQHVKINIQEDLLGYKLRELVKENYSGFNITLPYKISVLKLLDRINSTAKAVGAVNTIKNDHNRLCGYNTDWCGIYQLLVNNNKDK
ncbi:MAG: hypothetical protein LBE20_06175 [Deltaproteobacteria bacterium]|jgi:shikimate dehydrogenase|nr:hypothetical protein [Deltaproteobacteria bacterium]